MPLRCPAAEPGSGAGAGIRHVGITAQKQWEPHQHNGEGLRWRFGFSDGVPSSQEERCPNGD